MQGGKLSRGEYLVLLFITDSVPLHLGELGQILARV